MENEIMNFEETEIMDVEAESKPGISTGGAMLIGAGLVLLVEAGVKLVKKGVAAYKAKKELRKPDKEIEVGPEDLADVAGK